MDEWGYLIPAEDVSKYDVSKCTEFSAEMSYAEFSDGKYVFEDLVDGTYTVKETHAALSSFESVTTTYKLDNNNAQTGTELNVEISNHDDHTVNFTNTYENKTGEFDITIKKVHQNGETSINLYGAQFKL